MGLDRSTGHRAHLNGRDSCRETGWRTFAAATILKPRTSVPSDHLPLLAGPQRPALPERLLCWSTSADLCASLQGCAGGTAALCSMATRVPLHRRAASLACQLIKGVQLQVQLSEHIRSPQPGMHVCSRNCTSSVLQMSRPPPALGHVHTSAATTQREASTGCARLDRWPCLHDPHRLCGALR